MRNLKITREKRMNAAGVYFYVFLDGRKLGGIENGGAADVTISEGQHYMKVIADMGDGRHCSDEYEIRPGQKDVHCHIFRKIKLISKDDIYIDVK